MSKCIKCKKIKEIFQFGLCSDCIIELGKNNKSFKGLCNMMYGKFNKEVNPIKDLREIDKRIDTFRLNETNKNRYLLSINFNDNSIINIFLDKMSIHQLFITLKYHLKI